MIKARYIGPDYDFFKSNTDYEIVIDGNQVYADGSPSKRLVYNSAEHLMYEWRFDITDAKEFAMWLNFNYQIIPKQFEYYAPNTVDVLTFGSDFHYDRIKKEHGQTINQLYLKFKSL